MKQVLRKGFGEIIVDRVPDPELAPHQVLIRPLYSLISSGTETASIHQESMLKEVAEKPSHLKKVWEVMKLNGPLRTLAEVKAKFSDYAVLGYSGAGIVVDRHATVTDIPIGERVAYGGEGTGHGESIATGRNLVARVPEGVPFEHACFATLGSIALNAVRVAGIGLGESVAVLGQGLVGQLVTQLVRLQGGVTIAVDLRPERVQLACRLGADHGLMAGESLREAVSSLTGGRGVDCVIVAAAAKSAAPCLQALELCRDRGRIVIVGAVEVQFPWLEAYLKEIQVLFARAYGPGSYDPDYEKRGQDYPYPYVRWTENRNMEEFLRLLAGGRVRVDELITHRFPLEDASRAYQTILDPGSASLAVVLEYAQGSAGEVVAGYKPERTVEIPGPRPAKSGIGVALAGASNIARWAHMPSLRRLPGVSLRAVYSASGARGKSYARRFGARYCTSEYEQILADPEVDVVLITTRNQHHARQALAALEAGKHVFVEKPMALTGEECRDLHRAVEKSGRVLTVGFNRRFAPDYRRQKEYLANRKGPAVIHCRMNSPGISGDYWMADPSIGGAILGEACHFVDLMHWLLDSEPVSVAAYSLPAGKREPVGENNLAAVFQFADGSIGSLTYCTVGSRSSGGERVEIFAAGRAALCEDFKRMETMGSVRRRTSRWFAEKGYAAQMRAFFEAVREGRPAPVTVRDGARATLGCLRMLESARVHASVPVDLEVLTAQGT